MKCRLDIIKKFMTVLCFIIGLHKKKAAEMFSALKGLIRFMKLHPTMHCKVIIFLIILKKLFFYF